MSRVLLDVTVSLDGFMAGPDIGVEHAMGVGGEQLHTWIFNTEASEVDAAIAHEMFATTSAVILGRRTFDVGQQHWNDTPFPVPSFVLTHEALLPRQEQSATFTFVNDGIESALRQARAVAGDRYIRLMGANVSQQFLRAGLADEIHIQIVPLLLGAGGRLFDGIDRQITLQQTAVIQSPFVTHLYRVSNKEHA